MTPASRHLSFLALFLLASHSLSGADLPRSKVYAFTGARVMIAPGKSLDQATVVVRDGIIESVGNKEKPADALEIDATGLILHAGFIDGGSSSWVDVAKRPKEPSYVSKTETEQNALAGTPEDTHAALLPEFRVLDAFKLEEESLERARLRGFTSSVVEPPGGILSGQSALIALTGGSTRSIVLRDPLFFHLSFERQNREYPTTLMGMMAHLRQTMIDAKRHMQWRAREADGKGESAIPPRDVTLEALEPVLLRKRRLAIRANSTDEILRALAIGDEFSIDIVLVGGLDAYKHADKLKSKQIPVIYRLKLPEEPLLESPPPGRGDDEEKPKDFTKERPKQTFDPDMPLRARRSEARRWLDRLRGLRALQRSGVPIALSLEGLQGDDVQKNLDVLRKRVGMTNDEMLDLLTANAAKALGMETRLGTVEAGKLAHLVVRDRFWTDKDSYVRYCMVGDRVFEYASVVSKKDDKEKPTAESKPTAKPKDDAVPPSKEVAKKDEAKKKTEEERKEPVKEVFCEIDADRKRVRKTKGNCLITNATVITMSKAGTLVGVDILIRDGKIARIGKDLPREQVTTILDATGLIAMPGIIDTHSHMAIETGVNEYTLSITPECRIRDVIRSDDVEIYRSLAGGVTLARLLHGSANCIGGQDGVIKLRFGDSAPDLLLEEAPRGVKFALGENVKRTVGRFPNTRLGVEALLIRSFSEAQNYAREEADAKKLGTKNGIPFRRDLRLEALRDVLAGTLKVHCHCYRADEILMLLQVADRFGIKIKSLQHALEGYKVAPEIAAHGASISTFSDWWAYKWEAYDATPYNTPLLKEAGVETCIKSDSGELIRHLNMEAAKMLRYGMSANDALATITTIPAKQLGLESRVGSLEVGKDADIALFNGHPLNIYSRCMLTLVDGEVFFEYRPMEPNVKLAENVDRSLPKQEKLPMGDFPANADGRYALTDIAIHPVSGKSIERGTVLISKGKIEAVGENVSVPAGVKAWSLPGLHVYPGMVDAGTKVGLIEVDSASETVDVIEGGDFQPDLRAASGVHPDSELIPVTRAGGITSVVTMPAGGVIAGQSALVQLAGWVPKEMILADPLALHVRLPLAPRVPEANPKPFMGRGRFASSRRRKIEELKSLFRLAQYYHERKKSAEAKNLPAPIIDPRLEALEPYLNKQKPVIFRADKPQDIRDALKLADELKVRPIISGASDAWKMLAELKEKKVPLIVGPTLFEVPNAYDPTQATYANPGMIHRAGIKFCIQSDEGSNARNLPFNAGVAVAYGLDPEEALRSVTLSPAEILGVADKLGTVTPGKIANLQITDGDPLQPATRIALLFIGGEPILPTSRHTKLYDRYSSRLAAHKQKSPGSAGSK